MGPAHSCTQERYIYKSNFRQKSIYSHGDTEKKGKKLYVVISVAPRESERAVTSGRG